SVSGANASKSSCISEIASSLIVRPSLSRFTSWIASLEAGVPPYSTEPLDAYYGRNRRLPGRLFSCEPESETHDDDRRRGGIVGGEGQNHRSSGRGQLGNGAGGAAGEERSCRAAVGARSGAGPRAARGERKRALPAGHPPAPSRHADRRPGSSVDRRGGRRLRRAERRDAAGRAGGGPAPCARCAACLRRQRTG